MNAQHIRALILICVFCGLTRNANSQNAEKPGASLSVQADGSGTRPDTSPRPVNLTALSKDISGKDLRALMHDYSKAIGASCGYCHEENTQTKSMDFASDANPMKQTARLMIRMTNDINAKYLAQLGDRRYAEPLTCGNCHQGHMSPPSFEPKP